MGNFVGKTIFIIIYLPTLKRKMEEH